MRRVGLRDLESQLHAEWRRRQRRHGEAGRPVGAGSARTPTGGGRARDDGLTVSVRRVARDPRQRVVIAL